MTEKEEKSVLCVGGKGERYAVIVMGMAENNVQIAGDQDTIPGEIIVTGAMVRDTKSVTIATDEDLSNALGVLEKEGKYVQHVTVQEK